MKIRYYHMIFSAAVILTICLSYWGSLCKNKDRILSITAIQNKYSLTAPRNTEISTSNRNFLYLTQTESCLSDYLLGPGLFGNGRKSDIVVLCWKQPCSSASSRLQHIKYIYQENTTWSEGRNILYDFAKKLPNDYLYYIFMDDDLKFHFTSASFIERYRNLSIHWPLQAFEYFLLKHEPAIGVPLICHSNDGWCETMKFYFQPLPEYFPATIWFDAALNAFHKNAIHLILPYRLDLEHVGWWHSQKYVILAADLMFRGQILKFFAVTMDNNQHRKYPRKNWDNWADIYDILKAEIPKIYRDQVNWRPNESTIQFKPIIKNYTVITPMWTFKMPKGKIEVEPFKHFKT